MLKTAQPFEIIVDIIILVAVMVSAIVLTRVKPANE